jgi:myosin VIIa
MLETIRIRKAGFPTRIPFTEFFNNFKCILPSQEWNNNDPSATSVALVKKALVSDREWQIGKSKIFLKTEAVSLQFFFQLIFK